MNPSVSLRSAKILAAVAALSLLVAAGPGGGGPGSRGPQSSQGNQQCPPGQGQSGSASGKGNSAQGASGAQMAPVGGQGGEQGGNQGENGPDTPSDGPGQGPQNRPRNQGQTLSGAVRGYNLNPSGTPESMMLSTGNSTVQLNFPPEMAASIQSAATVGSQVTVVARSGGGPGGPDDQNGPGDQQPDHRVMNLESIKTASGSTLNVGGPGGGQNGQVTGTVKQLNYDRRGDVNGAQLDNGAFVHLRPGSNADLTVGEKVTVQGRQRTTSNGMKIIEAQSINGISLNDNGPGGQGNNGGPGGGGPPGGGPDGNGGAPGQ
jgi:hypothetical protein